MFAAGAAAGADNHDNHVIDCLQTAIPNDTITPGTILVKAVTKDIMKSGVNA